MTDEGNCGLTPWKPTPTFLPEEWVAFVEHMGRQLKDSPLLSPSYILDVRYSSKRVGDQLRDWQIPWVAVIAGYLWEIDDELIQSSGLPDSDQIIKCKRQSILYARAIEAEKLTTFPTERQS